MPHRSCLEVALVSVLQKLLDISVGFLFYFFLGCVLMTFLLRKHPSPVSSSGPGVLVRPWPPAPTLSQGEAGAAASALIRPCCQCGRALDLTHSDSAFKPDKVGVIRKADDIRAATVTIFWISVSVLPWQPAMDSPAGMTGSLITEKSGTSVTLPYWLSRTFWVWLTRRFKSLH